MKINEKKFGERLFYTAIILAVLIGIGTVYYAYAESWSYVDSFYFSTMTLTTVGYGDLVPTTPASKVVTALYALLGVGVMLYILSSVLGVFIFKQESKFERIFSHDRKREKEIKRQETEIKRKAEEIEKDLKRSEKNIEKIKRKIKK